MGALRSPSTKVGPGRKWLESQALGADMVWIEKCQLLREERRGEGRGRHTHVAAFCLERAWVRGTQRACWRPQTTGW